MVSIVCAVAADAAAVGGGGGGDSAVVICAAGDSAIVIASGGGGIIITGGVACCDGRSECVFGQVGLAGDGLAGSYLNRGDAICASDGAGAIGDDGIRTVELLAVDIAVQNEGACGPPCGGN